MVGFQKFSKIGIRFAQSPKNKDGVMVQNFCDICPEFQVSKTVRPYEQGNGLPGELFSQSPTGVPGVAGRRPSQFDIENVHLLLKFGRQPLHADPQHLQPLLAGSGDLSFEGRKGGGDHEHMPDKISPQHMLHHAQMAVVHGIKGAAENEKIRYL